MRISEYIQRASLLDKLENINAVRFGLFGETGSILTTAKKKSREGSSYAYLEAITEELGDAFWYYSRIVERLGFNINDVVPQNLNTQHSSELFATVFPDHPLSQAPTIKEGDLNKWLNKLGQAAAQLLNHTNDTEKTDICTDLTNYLSCYLYVLSSTGISFSTVLEQNLLKIEGRFLLPSLDSLPSFDKEFEEDERLPLTFEIELIQRGNGRTYLKWNGVFVGDPLSDNIGEEDGYRFHDVFHMANAAILGWSPTFRSLIRHKRKSSHDHDEIQDGGRAIVIEEGLTAWIFSQAKRSKFFAEHDTVSFDLLKGIRQFVAGFEVEACPMSLWERCILDGYSVFRQVRQAQSGRIIGDLRNRTIKFERL